jgi:hypothetical protein
MKAGGAGEQAFPDVIPNSVQAEDVDKRLENLFVESLREIFTPWPGNPQARVW